MAEFDTEQLALEKAPTVSSNQVPPVSSCETVFRQSDLAKRLEEFGPAFITPAVLCGEQFIKLRRALGIIAGTNVVTTMTILWSAL
jgi:hypothetical protein